MPSPDCDADSRRPLFHKRDSDGQTFPPSFRFISHAAGVTLTGELHIFQCNSHSAQQVVEELKHWMRRHGNMFLANEPNSPANVNVKETVHVFNAIAAQRE